MTKRLLHLADIWPSDIGRLLVTAGVIFFLVAANNLIKIVRDSVFLSHHSVAELP